MALYSMSSGFHQPYQVLGIYIYIYMVDNCPTLRKKIKPKKFLVDSEMCKDATERKIELLKQLTVILQGNVKPSMRVYLFH
jgi:U3 small nucleolar RNA-associated protein 23